MFRSKYLNVLGSGIQLTHFVFIISHFLHGDKQNGLTTTPVYTIDTLLPLYEYTILNELDCPLINGNRMLFIVIR